MSQNLQNFVKFQKSQLENLVDFEKCCQTHIYLQKSEPIQPKTSNNFAEILPTDALVAESGRAGGRAQLRALRKEQKAAHTASAGTGSDP